MTRSSGPLSSVPFDLLFLHLVLPASIDSHRPRHRLKKVWNVYWRNATAAFRLTSLMYGRRRSAEEKDTQGIFPVLDKPLQLLFGRYELEQTEARVPGADQIVLLSPAERQKGGVFVPVDASGAPRNFEDKLRLLKQDRASREAGRDPRTDYTVIWLPRYWRTRIHIFIIVTLTVVSMTLAVGFLGPLVVGRATMAMIFTEPMHDGYNLVRHLRSPGNWADESRSRAATSAGSHTLSAEASASESRNATRLDGYTGPALPSDSSGSCSRFSRKSTRCSRCISSCRD